MKEYLQVAFSMRTLHRYIQVLTELLGKQDQVEAALPENMLAGAKYIIGPGGDEDDGGASTTDSETDTETDSNADSDDTNAPAREKRKKDRSARKNGKKSTNTAKADKKAARMSIKGDGGGEGKGTKKKASKGKGKAGDEAEGSPRKRKRPEVEGEDDGAKSPKKSKKRDACDAEKQGMTTPRKRKRAGEGDDQGYEPDDDALSQPSPTRKSQRLAASIATSPATTPPTGTTATGGGSVAATSATMDTTDASATTSTTTAPAAGGALPPSTTSPTAPSAPDASQPPATAAPAPVPYAPDAPPRPVTTAPAAEALPAAAASLVHSGAPPPPSAAALGALPSLSAVPAPTSTTLPSITVAVPPDAPDWLRDSVKDLSKIDLGCHYASVLAALIRLEAAAKYAPQTNGPQRLASSKVAPRPTEISEWIKGGRGKKSKKSPVVSDVAKYTRSWDLWWDSLQLEWRKRDNNGRWRFDVGYGDDSDWGVLDCYGTNGLVSTVAGLYFWGVAQLLGTEEQRARWENAVHDVVWVLEGLEMTFKE